MQDLRITLIQSALHWEDIDRNLEMFSKKIALIKESSDLIMLPEMFSTGFTMQAEKFAESMDGRTFQWMSALAKQKNSVITGSIIVQENGKYFNRLIWMRPDGSFEMYDKRHLFHYGKEDEHYSAGNKKLYVELKGWKICPLICYDLRFPVWSRNKVQSSGTWDYDLLLYIANWPERRNHAWKTLLPARAIENQCYLAGLNRVGMDVHNIEHSGDSVVINAKGEIISKIKAKEEISETIVLSYEELSAYRASFPLGRDTDAFTIQE